MSNKPRGFRSSEGGKTINYKELLEETEQELEDLQARVDEAVAILAPDVDHARIERVETKLDILIRNLLSPERLEEINRELSGEEEPTS